MDMDDVDEWATNLMLGSARKFNRSGLARIKIV